MPERKIEMKERVVSIVQHNACVKAVPKLMLAGDYLTADYGFAIHDKVKVICNAPGNITVSKVNQ